MTITKTEIPRVSSAGISTGELIGVHGDLMLDLADDWRAGAKAANLDPDSGGNRWENCTEPPAPCCPHAKPSDPTGEAAITQRADFAAELAIRLERWHADSLWLRDAAHVMAPVVPPSTMNDPASDLWCAHHLRVGICEVRHRNDLCRFCDDFLKLWKAKPPISIVKDRNDGKRITEKMVKAALEQEGYRLDEVGKVDKAVKAARGATGRPNQNTKQKAS